MISNVVVSYTVRPEAIDEHVKLIEAVFAQLRTDAPANIEYKVMRLDDGVSFVHVSTADTGDGTNPLPQLAAFQAFAAGLGTRRDPARAGRRRHCRLVLPAGAD